MWQHSIHLIRSQPTALPLPDHTTVFKTWAEYDLFIQKSDPAIIVNGYTSEFCFEPRHSQHRYIQVIHSDDLAYFIPVFLTRKRWHQIILVSETLSRKVRFFGISGTIIPNGVPLPGHDVRQIHSELRLLYAGRLEQTQKNVLWLSQLSTHLSEMGADFKLRVVGVGSQAARLQNMIPSANFVGYSPPTDMWKHYSWADVLLLPSFFEGEPLCLLEACSFGCIPVTGEFSSTFKKKLIDAGLGFHSNLSQAAEWLVQLQATQRREDMQKEVSTEFMRSNQTLADMTKAYNSTFLGVLKNRGISLPRAKLRQLFMRRLMKIYRPAQSSRTHAAV